MFVILGCLDEQDASLPILMFEMLMIMSGQSPYSCFLDPAVKLRTHEQIFVPYQKFGK